MADVAVVELRGSCIEWCALVVNFGNLGIVAVVDSQVIVLEIAKRLSISVQSKIFMFGVA